MEDISFQNMDSWKGGSGNKYGLTFKQIVLMHINRCVINGSVEWHGGYWNETGSNPITRVYVQNSRDVYNNSVKILRALLLGYFDKPMREAETLLNKEMDIKQKTYNEYQEKSKELKYEWNEFKVNWHLKMFEQLIMLSKRLNFFEEESSEEEL